MADRANLMRELYEVSFAADDLRLYLDTHPADEEALMAFSEASGRRKQLLKEMADSFEPLTSDCICPETNNRTDFNTKYPEMKHFAWIDGPAPWEGGCQ